MPRKQRRFDETPRRGQSHVLVARLADELRHKQESGQPVIDEEFFPTGKIRVVVIWDEWDRLALEDRTAVILQAYEAAEGREYRDKIALASGLTVPEAFAAGMLPYEVIPALRKSDSFSLDQCRDAMIEEGASTLLGPERVQLRFATHDEAESARRRLAQRLPGSDQIWIVTQDVGSVEDWSCA
jgi:hypothetical protein